LYGQLREFLSPEAANFWDTNMHIISRGLIMNGRYERFVKLAGKLLQLLAGKEESKKIFYASINT
jgi:hypothetical protein